MKSDVILVANSGSGMEAALAESERMAAACALPHKEAIRLRLLTEEMLGMFRAIAGQAEASFWIEEEKGLFSLHLASELAMTGRLRRDMLAVSTSGKNEAARGFMGKIREMFEQAMEPLDDGVPLPAGTWLPPIPDSPGFSVTGSMEMGVWSLNRYRGSLREDDRDKWDELEKSVVGKLADEVRIAVTSRRVEMVIEKKFA